jgi:hypothetical protein
MRIMPAGVHQTWPLRGIRYVIGFLHSQGVHVGTEAHSGPARAQPGHNAGPGHASLYLYVQALEGIRDKLGRLIFLEAKFGVHVDCTPPSRDLILQSIRTPQ